MPIARLRGGSFNSQWPGFRSTQLKALSWSVRKPALALKVKAQDLDFVLIQEMGKLEAAAFFLAMGQKWSYQRFGPLNVVGWRNDRLSFKGKILEIDFPDYGQYPGRGAIVAELYDKAGNRLRVGSLHLPVKVDGTGGGVADHAAQAACIQKFVSAVNDEKDDAPLVWGGDTNNRQSRTVGQMWLTLRKYGHQWVGNGINVVGYNFGATVTNLRKVDLGTGSDHDLLVFNVSTSKK